jgi:hypothetical protein
MVCVVCPYEESTHPCIFCLLFWASNDSYVEASLKCGFINFAVLIDNMVFIFFHSFTWVT